MPVFASAHPCCGCASGSTTMADDGDAVATSQVELAPATEARMSVRNLNTIELMPGPDNYLYDAGQSVVVRPGVHTMAIGRPSAALAKRAKLVAQVKEQRAKMAAQKRFGTFDGVIVRYVHTGCLVCEATSWRLSIVTCADRLFRCGSLVSCAFQRVAQHLGCHHVSTHGVCGRPCWNFPSSDHHRRVPAANGAHRHVAVRHRDQRRSGGRRRVLPHLTQSGCRVWRLHWTRVCVGKCR